MKSSTIRFAFVAIFLFGYSFSFASQTKKEAHEIAITPVENLYLGKSVEKVWTISYSEQKRPVTIALHTVSNGKEYIVRSEFFEVIYTSGKAGFGVKKMHSMLKEVPNETNVSVLNKQQMKGQKIITTNDVSDTYALGLIASYLPDLLNEEYKYLIY
jgi:hypothetical protein